MSYPLKTSIRLGLGLRTTGLAMGNTVARAIRYFNRLDGTDDFISISSATVDRIVMDVVPVSTNAGLPTGAPAVTAGEYQTIDFAFIGSISEIGKNGASFFDGIIANVVLYFGGVAIHDYDVNDNSADINDSIGSNDGTLMGGSGWGLFQEVAPGGDWLGQELVVNGGFDTDSDWVKTGGSTIAGGLGIVDGTGGSSLLFQAVLEDGLSYRSSIDVASEDGNVNNEVIDNNGAVLHEVSGVGLQVFDINHSIVSPNYLLKANGGIYSVDSVSVKELLKVS